MELWGNGPNGLDSHAIKDSQNSFRYFRTFLNTVDISNKAIFSRSKSAKHGTIGEMDLSWIAMVSSFCETAFVTDQRYRRQS